MCGLWVAGWGWTNRKNWETGNDLRALLDVKQIATRNQLHTQGTQLGALW